MRNALFDTAGRIGHILVAINKYISIGLIQSVRFFSNIGFSSTHFVIQNLLRIIDNSRFEMLQAYYSQKDMHLELETISNVIKVKEDALDRKKWTVQHTEALELLGSRLINECDWSERRMHVYMKSVVESIPGLHYMVDIDEYDDDDDDEAIAIE
jgi:hypothetical protein